MKKIKLSIKLVCLKFGY